MEALRVEAFKIALFILPGIISLRIKAALSISAPSRPFNLAIDGPIFTLIDHALFGLIEWCLTSLSSFAPARWLRALGEAIQTSPSLPGELGRQFSEAGGFPMILIAIGVGLVFGVTRHHGWDFRLLRKLKLTDLLRDGGVPGRLEVSRKDRPLLRGGWPLRDLADRGLAGGAGR